MSVKTVKEASLFAIPTEVRIMAGNIILAVAFGSCANGINEVLSFVIRIKCIRVKISKLKLLLRVIKYIV